MTVLALSSPLRTGYLQSFAKGMSPGGWLILIDNLVEWREA